MKRTSTSRNSRAHKRARVDRTDYERFASMTDADIDFSQLPEITPEMFARGVARRNFKIIPRKTQLTLRIDSDVIDWYKKQGRGYQTKINALLRAYMQEHQRHRA